MPQPSPFASILLIGPVTALAAASLSVLIAGCTGASPLGEAHSSPDQAPLQRTLTLGAYTTPRDAYDKEIIPAFLAYWKDKTGQEVVVETSYQGSGGQSRAIVGGFEADIAALSLEPDIQRIVHAGLITHDWKDDAWGGMVTASIAVPAVRPGNPKGIQDWGDLTRTDVDVVTPNPRTSGGAMWNIAALYGASMRGYAEVPRDDELSTLTFISQVLARVRIMDKGARESVLTFEQGVGDVAITYENEVLTAKLIGKQYDYVVPRSTILIVNPIAVVDANVDAHGNRDVAEAFVDFVRTPEVQRMYAKYGYRPIVGEVGQELTERFVTPEDLFTIEDLGGWPRVTTHLFDPDGVFDRAMESARRR